MAHDIISRSAAILGVKPKFGDDGSALLVSYSSARLVVVQ